MEDFFDFLVGVHFSGIGDPSHKGKNSPGKEGKGIGRKGAKKADLPGEETDLLPRFPKSRSKEKLDQAEGFLSSPLGIGAWCTDHGG